MVEKFTTGTLPLSTLANTASYPCIKSVAFDYPHFSSLFTETEDRARLYEKICPDRFRRNEIVHNVVDFLSCFPRLTDVHLVVGLPAEMDYSGTIGTQLVAASSKESFQAGQSCPELLVRIGSKEWSKRAKEFRIMMLGAEARVNILQRMLDTKYVEEAQELGWQDGRQINVPW